MNIFVLSNEIGNKVVQRLYKENGNKLFYIARQKVDSDAEAETAIFTCFQRLMKSFPKYWNLSYKQLGKLCCRVTRNIAIDMAREKQKNVDSIEDAIWNEEPDILEEMIEQSDKEVIVWALLELTEEEREFISLQYEFNLKPREIGNLLGISSKEVRKRMLVYRKKLAYILKNSSYNRNVS